MNFIIFQLITSFTLIENTIYMIMQFVFYLDNQYQDQPKSILPAMSETADR